MSSYNTLPLPIRIAVICIAIGLSGCSKSTAEPTAASREKRESTPKADEEKHDREPQPNSSADKNSQPGSSEATSQGAASSEKNGERIPGGSVDAKSASGSGNGEKASSNGSSPGALGVHSSSGDPNYKPPTDPRSAQTAAEQALKAAEKAASTGEYGTAYRKALGGWQQVNTYSKQDEKCRELAQILLNRLEQYGEKANRAAGVVETSPSSHKVIILK